MTSYPNKFGIFRRDCSTATRWSSFVRFAPRTFSVEPSNPFFRRSICSGRKFPSPSPSSCCSWPNFSANVILASNALTRASTFVACFECDEGEATSKRIENAKTNRIRRCELVFIVLEFLSRVSVSLIDWQLLLLKRAGIAVGCGQYHRAVAGGYEV